MPFKDFAAGEVLTSSDVDTYLMSQVIIRCTSGTRPASPSEGWHIYETDTQRFMVYKSGAWVTERPDETFAHKTADESVTSSTTRQNDDHLFASVLANSIYTVEMLIRWTGPDIAIEFTSANAGNITFIGIGKNPTGAVARNDGFSWADVGSSAGGFTEYTGGYLAIRGILTMSSTAGTFRFRWAQNVSSGSSSTVKAGSWLRITRVL